MNKPNTNRELIDVGPRVRPSVAIEEVEDESGEFVIFLFFTWSGPEMCITETLGPIGGVLGMGEHLLERIECPSSSSTGIDVPGGVSQGRASRKWFVPFLVRIITHYPHCEIFDCPCRYNPCDWVAFVVLCSP